MIDTSIDLQEFDTAFESASSPNGEVPDGTYTARICDVSLLRSKAGNPMLVWDLRILGPESQGRMLKKRRAITDKTIAYVRQELETCGLTMNKMSELNGQLHRMIDLDLEILKTTRNSDTNIYFNRRMELTSASIELTDDDLPF
jgi:hypothetical protein